MLVNKKYSRHAWMTVQYEYFEESSVEKFARAIKKFDFFPYGV